jgi:hypothetical protein
MISFKQFLEAHGGIDVATTMMDSGHTHWRELTQQLTQAIGQKVTVGPDAFDNSLIYLSWTTGETDKADLVFQTKLAEKQLIKHMDALGFVAVNWDGPNIQLHRSMKHNPLAKADVKAGTKRITITVKVVAGPA